MKLHVAASGGARLEDANNFGEFAIVEAVPGAAASLGAAVGAAEENHYWLDAEAIIALSMRAEDAHWVDQFWTMLRSVEPYGYSDMANKRVKAHVE